MDDSPARILLVDLDHDGSSAADARLAGQRSEAQDRPPIHESAKAIEAILENEHDLVVIVDRPGFEKGLELVRQAASQGCLVPVVLTVAHRGDERELHLSRLAVSIAEARRGLPQSDLRRSHDVSRIESLVKEVESLRAELRRMERLETELRFNDRRKNEFLGSLAHDLRNPLVPIRNALEIMRLSTSKPAVIESSRNMIGRQLKQLIQLIHELADLTRVLRGTVDLHRTTTEAAEIVHSALEDCGGAIEKSGLTLNLDLPANPTTLNADAARLSQALRAMLETAGRGHEPGGQVWLKVAPEGPNLVFRVWTDASPLSAERLDRIFDLLPSGLRTSEERLPGLGTGTAMARVFARLHGGDLEARNPGPSVGTEFRLWIPMDAAGGAS